MTYEEIKGTPIEFIKSKEYMIKGYNYSTYAETILQIKKNFKLETLV